MQLLAAKILATASIGLAFPLEQCVREAAQLVGIAPPALAFDDSMSSLARYQYGTVVLRADADCGVVIHEMVHHRQFRDAGPALSRGEWVERESEARRLELLFRGE